jgi:hypothetical protein
MLIFIIISVISIIGIGLVILIVINNEDSGKKIYGVCTFDVTVYGTRYNGVKFKVRKLEEYDDDVVVKPVEILSTQYNSYTHERIYETISSKQVVNKTKVKWANESNEIVLEMVDIEKILNGETLEFDRIEIKASEGVNTNELLDTIIKKV